MWLILIVDSDTRETEWLRSVLTSQGWWVMAVEDRESALRTAAARAPNLVFVSGQIPGAYDLVRSFCRKNGGPGTLLYTTGADTTGFDRERDLSDGFISSPFTSQELIDAVRDCVVESRSVAAGPEGGQRGRDLTSADIFGAVIDEIEGKIEKRPADEVGDIDLRRPAPQVRLERDRTPQASPGDSAVVDGPDTGETSGVDLETGSGRAEEVKTTPISTELHSGQRFGPYVLKERIAVGGMAEVWQAEMTGVEGFKKSVAIKKILPHLAEGDFIEMFIDEAKVAAQLNHNNITNIYDLGRIGDDYYIAMEYVSGRDLRAILAAAKKNGRSLPIELALLIAARLAGALDYAHRKRGPGGQPLGIIHRDVSPPNVLIGEEGDIKLCDFGVAKAVSKASKTQTGSLKGKLQYMSPEQAWGRILDPRSDIFSLGSILYEMLTGSRLFKGDSEMSLLEAVRSCQVRPPQEIRKEIPDSVVEIMDKALAVDPGNRFASADEMREEIEAVSHGMKSGAGNKDLGAFVLSLFVEEEEKAEPVRSSGSGVAEGLRSLPTLAEEVTTQSESDVSQVLETGTAISQEARTSRGRWLLRIGLAAVLLVLFAGLGWWAISRWQWFERAAETEGANESSEAAPSIPEQVEAAIVPDVVDQVMEQPAPSLPASEDGAPGLVAGDSLLAPEPESVESIEQKLEEFVDAEMQGRETEVRKRFEEEFAAEKARLERELAKLKEETGGDGAEPDGAN